MAELAVDFSNARLDPGAVKAAGVTTVMRYLAPSNWPKALSAAEAQGYLRAGLRVGLNYETTTTRALEGYAAGQADAHAANGYADAIGAPSTAVIFYSVDTGASFDQISPYFLGLVAAGGRPVGVYGPLPVCRGLRSSGLAKYTWVTNAASWSGFGSWSALAAASGDQNMLQHLDHPLPSLPANAYDFNEIFQPFPRWGDPVAPPPPPKPLPSPPASATTQLQGDEVKLTSYSFRSDAQGRGWLVTVPWDTFVAVTAQGSAPAVDGYWKSPRVAAQERNGKALVVLQECEPNANVTFYVAHTA